jgi:uncharacterized integral membrane protein
MKVVYTIVLTLLVMFVVTFSLENTGQVELRYYDFFQSQIQTYMLIFIAFLAGVIFTGFMGIVERFRLTRTINRLNKTIRDLRREMKANNNPPYVEEAGKVSPPFEE